LYSWFKRAFDIAASGAALLLLAPLMAVLAALVRLESRGPAFFRQRRLGKGGKPFTAYKLRTMHQNARPVRNPDGSYFVGAGDPRLTRLGRFLRETSLDELPQLINILKGDMSVVGPRPDQLADLELYDDLLRMKLLVRPGLASLAAVYGRNTLTWRKRARWEAFYVRHVSMRLDAYIIWRIAILTLKRDGVYYATPPRPRETLGRLE